MSDEAARAELLRLRASIDNIDAALIFLLAERFRATQQVGHLKADHEMPASDPKREEQQVARLRALAEEAHLDRSSRRSGSTSSSPRSSATTRRPPRGAEPGLGVFLQSGGDLPYFGAPPAFLSEIAQNSAVLPGAPRQPIVSDAIM